jgi:hypothetical protein
MVFVDRVLRRIFGPKREEVAGDWRRLHNEHLSNLYASRNISREIKSRSMRWMSPRGRPRSRWKNNIRMYLREVE